MKIRQLFTCGALVITSMVLGNTSLAAGTAGQASYTYKVIYTFPKNGLVTSSNGSLVFDTAGNLYGAGEPGQWASGAVYELSPNSDGQWTQQVLYSLSLRIDDNTDPMGALILDTAGNIYGTGYQGGSHNCGGVFQLVPQIPPVWSENVLARFKPKFQRGCGPQAALVVDGSGNLYGTTATGGSGNFGVVFEISPGANGTWTNTVIHSFIKNRKDGLGPLYTTLVFDKAGNLYGTTTGGGTGSCKYGCGTVFELIPGANGKWTEKVLHSFQDNDKDGQLPSAGVIIDGAGNLYGVTYGGGTDITDCGTTGCGTIFEVSPTANGKWKEKVLHSFNYTKGAFPISPLLLDTAGNLYGTASTINGGVIFQLIPGSNGTWTEKVLHDGGGLGAVISDSQGNLYGTEGTIVFELVRSAN